ncbi:cytochrome c biogenesis protein CcsA [Ferruginibacter albus]|uniref:cytochrome c biogenesis protein CcsA n=1 Tax=Ferruginibacter albus TaxID=2875540 RepID=UPI001CC396A7|nr:cytochrome c biogenesis protein CcsA [Ferruginibacter albus]UAY52540.1 cytochrome c biogenesis protein [Ferruginibacter albus]
MNKSWWKILAAVLLLYTFTAGFLIHVPDIGNLRQTIRNLFFHVPMWFAQMILLGISLVYSMMYLYSSNLKHDIYASVFAQTGILLGFLGLFTGMIWANYTWGAPWSNDPKQMCVAIALLIYLAYLVLRSSMTDIDKRAKVSAVYNIFAYFIYVPLIMILPRMVESLHPGGKGVQGNPGLNGADLDATMRLVFWPAVIGWTLLGVWISTLSIRIQLLRDKSLIHA